MEVILFRKNEITIETFKNQLLFKIINYHDVSELKHENYGNFTELDLAKAGIDLLDKTAERNRRAAAKYLHEYALQYTYLGDHRSTRPLILLGC